MRIGQNLNDNISGCSEDIVYLGNFPSRALRSLPLSVMMSGNFDWLSGNLGNRGVGGRFWASTLSSYSHSRDMSFGSTNVNPKNSNGKLSSYSLRCVAHPKSPPLFNLNRVSEVRSALQILCTFSSRALRSLPLSVMLSGDLYWGNGTIGNRGTHGYFWSSTPYSYAGSLSLYFNSTNVNPSYGYYKPLGFPLRCVARFPPKSPPLFHLNKLSEVRSALKILLRLSFQSSPQPSSFGYVVGLL